MAKVLLGTSAGNGNGALRDWRGLLSLRLTVGPAAYIVLTVMVLQHPVLSNHAIVLTGDVFLGLSVAGLANALAFLGLALLYAWRRIVFHGLRYQAIVVVLLVTGIIGEFALSGAGEGMIVPMVAANVLSGVGLACLAVGQVRLFAGAPSRQAAANLLVGMFGAALAIALAAMLDPLLSLFACLLLVDVSFAALRVEGGRGAAARYGEKTPLAIPWKLVATLAVQGLSTGFVQKSVVLASQEGFFLAEGIAFVLAGLLALVFLWRLNRDFNHLLYVIAFPLLALGHLAMALVGGDLGRGYRARGRLSLHHVPLMDACGLGDQAQGSLSELGMALYHVRLRGRSRGGHGVRNASRFYRGRRWGGRRADDRRVRCAFQCAAAVRGRRGRGRLGNEPRCNRW